MGGAQRPTRDLDRLADAISKGLGRDLRQALEERRPLRDRAAVDSALDRADVGRGPMRAALSQTLRHGGLRLRQRVALAALATKVREGELPLFQGGRFVTSEAFASQAEALGVPARVAAVVHGRLEERFMHFTRRTPRASRVASYLTLLESGVTSRADLLRLPSASVAQALGLSAREAVGLTHHVLREADAERPFDFVRTGDKGQVHVCCPPFDEPRWQERYDFFGERSRLGAIVTALRQDVRDRIRASFAALITPEVALAARAFGVGDSALYDTAAPGAPFFGSGEAIDRIEDLGAKTTRAEAEAWLGNIRRQLEQVRGALRVNAIETWIRTSDRARWNDGGGDGSRVVLNILGPNGAIMNAAPPPTGGGWPIDTSNYNDGTAAFEFWGAHYPNQTPIPVGNGTFPALDVSGFELQYGSTNDWLFESAGIWFRYEVNGHSRLLTDGQPADDTQVRSDDRVHWDPDAGWITLGFVATWGVHPESRLFVAREAFARLVAALNMVEGALTSTDLTNLYLTRGDEIIDALRAAALETRRGEHGLARGHYGRTLAILSVLDLNNLGPLDRELLFAIRVLLAASWMASGSLPHAYAELLEAYALVLPDDADALAFLWHQLADLFVRWGENLYAAAGSDYRERLVALDRFSKVLAPSLAVTYDDGREDEVLELWLDLARGDGSLPADPAAWVRELAVRPVRAVPAAGVGAAPNSATGFLPAYGRPLPVLGHEVLPDPAARSRRFLRVRLDVAEARLTRADLDLTLSNLAIAVGAWAPTSLRMQVVVAGYNPAARPEPGRFRGRRSDILVLYDVLRAPTTSFGRTSWNVGLAAHAIAGRRAIPAPEGCAAELLRRRVRVRMDQVRAHLNAYGVHDEYVPNGRFQALRRLAAGLTERAVYLQGRYVDFLSRAEAASLEALDAAFMRELEEANVELARKRAAQANEELAHAVASAAAAGRAVDLSERTLNQFQQTWEIGFLRFLNSVSIGIPPNVGLNLGGYVGSVTGADGYEEQFRTRELEYQAAVERARAAAESAEFQRRLAEIERLIAEDSLTLEEARAANVRDRLGFLENRTLNATTWYEMARLYRELAETQVQTAGRWAWMAERALEFETNVPVSRVRMDYHLLPLGAERLRSDLDALDVALAEYRERFRDVPNVIEREFRFSVDFPEQFRALTSLSAAPPTVALGPGVRAVEFRTSMVDYDARLPGRYAFGRVLGVEVELLTDVAASVFSGHLENARLVRARVGSVDRDVALSESLVRVPIPRASAEPAACPPAFDLENEVPPDSTAVPEVELDWEAVPVEAVPLADDRGREARRRARGVDPLIEAMWRPHGIGGVTPALRSVRTPARAGGLVGRARAAGVGRAELQHAANALVGDRFHRDPAVVRAERERQLGALNGRFAGSGFALVLGDLDALVTLRGDLEFVDNRAYGLLTAAAQGLRGRRTWERYELALEVGPALQVFRDVTPGHGALRTRPFDVIPDYVRYPADGPAYGLRVKRHDAESLTLSGFRVREDGIIFNPYNAGDQLGVFENNGIDADWRLTLRALPQSRLSRAPQWDKIREIVLRVWYHAAYERAEGFRLASVIEPQAIRYAQEKVLSISLYRDFYDDMRTLVGDYDERDPSSLPAVRAFTDATHPQTGGFIPFTVDEKLVAVAGHRISAALLVFTTPEPSTFPNYTWQLRRGAPGPVVQGNAVGDAGALATRMSAPAPAGLGGLDPRGKWFFRLAAADNAGLGLGEIQDIEIVFELEPI